MASSNFILLAEDDEDDQELIRMAFSKVTADHHFKIVSNGQELLSELSQQNKLPCLIIIDLNMPVLNGFQTLMALNKEPKFEKVPKVVLTTSDHDDSKRRSFSHGAVDYFVKPSNMQDLITTAERILTYCQ